MGFFGNIADNIKGLIQDSQEKKKEEKAIINRMRLEAAEHGRQVFEEEFQKNAKEIAIGQAKKRAAETSGIHKLRATNRLRNMESDQRSPVGVLAKLSQHTQRNLAKREENIKRTEELRETAKQMREDELAKRKTNGEPGMGNSVRKPFAGRDENRSTWY